MPIRVPVWFERVKTKGQLISEIVFDVLVSENATQKLLISAQESKNWSDHKIKALYNVII